MHPCARGHAIHGTANQLLNMYMYMKQLMRQKLHVQTQLRGQIFCLPCLLRCRILRGNCKRGQELLAEKNK